MHIEGGYVGKTATAPTPMKKSLLVVSVEFHTSVEIITMNGEHFTLHRANSSVPAIFFMTRGNSVEHPVISETRSDGNYSALFTEFKIEEDFFLARGSLNLYCDEGYRETHRIRNFIPHPATSRIPAWKKDMRRGILRKGRPKGTKNA